MKRRCVLLSGLSLAVLVAAPLSAAEHERLLYTVQFRGFRIGEVVIGLDQSSGQYRSEMHAQARGLAKVFNNFQARLFGEGHVGEQSTPALRPAHFWREWGGRRWAQQMTVSFDPATNEAVPTERIFNPATGQAIKREDLPGRRKKPPPPVSMEHRFHVLDPMTAFITGRDMMRLAWRENTTQTFRLPVYDGQRRYDVIIEMAPTQTEKIGGTAYNVIPATTRMEPIGGFDEKMAKRSREGKGRIVFSADDRFLPLQISMGNSLGRGMFTFAADCKTSPDVCTGFAEAADVAAQ